jgi:DNA-directed RNA polymerase specialized sigma subunit
MGKNLIKSDREFQKLAEKVNFVLENNKKNKLTHPDKQKEQVEKLFALEKRFKRLACKYSRSKDIYYRFIEMVSQDKGNMLSARPYFREKSSVFNKQITPTIKEKNVEKLMTYNINYQFISFIVDNWGDNFPPVLQETYDNFIKARNVLIENNIPLAINRAKIFYRKTPASHLSLIDLIDICIYGLSSGVDKYAGEYRKVWRSVCIGRMVGNMIEEYSKSFLKMYPSDRKILYRANSIKFRQGIEDIKDLTKAVNESFKVDAKEGKKIPKLPITESYLTHLMNGSGYVSVESSNDEEGFGVYDKTEDYSSNVEDNIIKTDISNKIYYAAQKLKVIERKVIRLKGVDL